MKVEKQLYIPIIVVLCTALMGLGWYLHLLSLQFAKMRKFKEKAQQLEQQITKLKQEKAVQVQRTKIITPNSGCQQLELNRELLVYWVMKHSLKGKMYRRLAEEIVDTCLEFEGGKYTLILLALMKRESNFYIFNKSKAGALGLGQFTKATIKEMINAKIFNSFNDVFDPKKHIPGMLMWLRKKGMGKNGENFKKALYGYIGASPENKKAAAYVNDVISNLGELYTLLFKFASSTQCKVKEIKK